MSGFDLPPINGFDLGFKRSPLPSSLLSPEGVPGLQRPEPLRGIDRAIEGGAGDDVTNRPFSGVLADSIDAGKLVAPFDLAVTAKYRYFVASTETSYDRPKVRVFRDWLMREARKTSSKLSKVERRQEIET